MNLYKISSGEGLRSVHSQMQQCPQFFAGYRMGEPSTGRSLANGGFDQGVCEWNQPRLMLLGTVPKQVL